MIRRLVLIALVYGVLFGYRLPAYGMYYPNVDLLYCTDPSTCWHELGHKMDRDMGYISRSREWADALRFIVVTETNLPDISFTAGMVLYQPGLLDYSPTIEHPIQELYAIVYQQAGGNVSRIHPTLQPFYSASPTYSQLHRCLVAGRVRTCGKALYVARLAKR